MRTESDTPIEQRFLMILGRLSHDMIKELDECQIPQWMERMKGRMEASTLAAYDRYANRDKSRDQAFYTLYAYADIDPGRRYDCLFRKDNAVVDCAVDCTVEHAIYEGWFPTEQIEHGHKHILFLRFCGNALGCIHTFENWADIGREDWKYGLCDRASHQARLRKGEHDAAQDGESTGTPSPHVS